MTKPNSDAAAPEDTGSRAKAEPKQVSMEEAVDKAMKDTKGESAAGESTTQKPKAGPESKAAGTDEDPDPDAEQGAEGEEEDEESEGDEEAAELYTAEELRKTHIFDIDLDRVPPELRPHYQEAQRKITQSHMDAARDRRSKGEETQQPEEKQKPKEKVYSREELWEMSQESPEGWERANDIALRQRMPELLKELGIDPADAKAQSETNRVLEAIDLASEAVPDLKDEAFKRAVGDVLANDPVFKRKLQQFKDPESIALVIENAAHRVTKKQVVAKQAQIDKQQRQVTKDQETARKAKEKANASQPGSIAAESTTRGTGTSAGAQGKFDVGTALTAAVDGELKGGGYKHIR